MNKTAKTKNKSRRRVSVAPNDHTATHHQAIELPVISLCQGVESITHKLSVLDECRKKGLITDSEYNDSKSKILLNM